MSGPAPRKLGHVLLEIKKEIPEDHPEREDFLHDLQKSIDSSFYTADECGEGYEWRRAAKTLELYTGSYRGKAWQQRMEEIFRGPLGPYQYSEAGEETAIKV